MTRSSSSSTVSRRPARAPCRSGPASAAQSARRLLWEPELDRREKIELSRLIDIVNERFGTEFKPADQLFFDQISEEACADSAIQQAAKANSLENFGYVFDKALEDKFIDRMDQNQEIFARYMNDKDFQKVVAEWHAEAGLRACAWRGSECEYLCKFTDAIEGGNMGHELWISPITGYRRRGTRLAEMRALFAAGIQARAILEPLQCCPADAPALEMKRILEKRGFDVAGVQQKPDGPVIGYVEREQLQGVNASEHLLHLNSEQLVSDSTSISEVLAALQSKERVFVVVGAGVKGIITRADLNKPPVRIYLFGLISLLEMHLRYWVRAVYGDESWETKLKANRLETAKNLQEARRTRNDHISLLACLQFSDLRQLVLDAEEIRTKLNLGSKTKGKALLENAEELRNRLAHSQDDLVEGMSWEQLIDLVESIYETVSVSDETVEERVRSGANNTTSLWLAG